MSEANNDTPLDAEALFLLKHDIKNQLSNIHLAIEGLRYEIEGEPGDQALYLDSLTQSAKKIDLLLNSIG